jgi:hypothetical protein
VNSPIFIRLGNRARGPENPPPGFIRRINISNIVVSGAHRQLGSILSGLPGRPIEQVRISNMQILQDGGGTTEDAALRPPEREADYPEPDMFGTMPSYGFFIRHVRRIDFRDIDIRTGKEDFRPAFVLVDVAGADIDHVKWSHLPAAPSILLRDVSDVSIRLSSPVPDIHVEHAEEKQY